MESESSMPASLCKNDTFRIGNDTRLNACVGYNGIVDIHTYQRGYHEATIALINSVKNFESHTDGVIYPIVFSARHTIELFLKGQLYYLHDIQCQVNGIESEKLLQKTHSIKTLWEDYRKLTEIDIRFNVYVNDLEAYIIDFYEIDDTGETFRYPYDHEDTRHLADISCINIAIFERRYQKMYDIIESLGYLTEFLVYEYKEGTFVKGLSREQLKEIAMKLPPKCDWGQDVFVEAKREIMQQYSISSKTFSKALNLIQNHMEFASYIDVEIPIDDINVEELSLFVNIFIEYQDKLAGSTSFDVIKSYIHTISHRLSVESIYALSALYEIGRYKLYSESYYRVLKELRERDVFLLIFENLIADNRIVLERIEAALLLLGQKTLLKQFKIDGKA